MPSVQLHSIEGDFVLEIVLRLILRSLVRRPFVKDGQWTFGIFDMWTKKAKVAKQSVHIPCWDRCRGPTCPCFLQALLHVPDRLPGRALQHSGSEGGQNMCRSLLQCVRKCRR